MHKIAFHAPARISLFGGGTDVPSYSEVHGGAVISMAIDIYNHYYIDYLNKSIVTATNFSGYISSGLGSSASFFVSFIAAQAKVNGITMTPYEIASRAWVLENTVLGKYTGKQDHYISALGGFRLLVFNKEQTVESQLLPVGDISDWIILLYTGRGRDNNKIQNHMKSLSKRKIKSLHEIKKLVLYASDAIRRGDYYTLGGLLADSWEMKKELDPHISNPYIDGIYATGMENGAIGGKLLGAGGGGYMIFICDPQKNNKLKQALRSPVTEIIDFSIDMKGVYESITP